MPNSKISKLPDMAGNIGLTESKLRLPFYGNTLPMMIWDFHTLEIIDVNDAAEKTYGYTREEFLQLNMRQLRAEEDVHLIEAITKNEETYGIIHNQVWRHRKKNGDAIFMDVSGYAFSIDARRVVINHNYDLTEKVATEYRLKESENRYRLIFNKTPLPMLIYNLNNYRVLEVNDIAVGHYGYSRDEFLSMTIYDYRPKDEISAVKNLLDNVNDLEETEGVYQIGIYNHLKKDGTLFRADIIGYRINYNNADCMMIIINDVTEKEKALQKMLENKQKLRAAYNERNAILESIDDGFFTINNDYIVTYWNKVAERVMNKKRKDILGRDLRDLYPDVDGRTTYRHYEKAFKERESQSFEMFNNEIKCWFEVMVYPSENGLSVYFKDITERLKHTKTIIAQNQKLRQIAWMQSHLTRVPVANILGLVDLFKNTKLSDVERGELMDHLFESSKNLDSVITSIVKKIEEFEDR